jgi:hypothetical protein
MQQKGGHTQAIDVSGEERGAAVCPGVEGGELGGALVDGEGLFGYVCVCVCVCVCVLEWKRRKRAFG